MGRFLNQFLNENNIILEDVSGEIVDLSVDVTSKLIISGLSKIGYNLFITEGDIPNIKLISFSKVSGNPHVSGLCKESDLNKTVLAFLKKKAIKKYKKDRKLVLEVENPNQIFNIYIVTNDGANRKAGSFKFNDIEKLSDNKIIVKKYNTGNILKEDASMTDNKLSKTYSDTHLYSIVRDNYNKKIMTFIRTSHEVDKFDDSFKDIEYDVKRRQTSAAILKVLQSQNIVLMISDSNIPMPRDFKVFAATDIRTGEDKKKKVFIDVTGIIKYNDGVYKIDGRGVDILISYLIAASVCHIYYADPKRLIMDRDVINSGAKCFSKLFAYVIDYLIKISVNGNLRSKVLYVASVYYINTILNKDMQPSYYKLCRDISGLSEREAELTMMEFEEQNLQNIKTLVAGLGYLCKDKALTLDVIVSKWIYLYGMGTQFALELFPAFSTMITHAYNGQFLNNQPAIEKQCDRDMVVFSKSILSIMEEATK